jgi:hypothetical protein
MFLKALVIVACILGFGLFIGHGGDRGWARHHRGPLHLPIPLRNGPIRAFSFARNRYTLLHTTGTRELYNENSTTGDSHDYT